MPETDRERQQVVHDRPASPPKGSRIQATRQQHAHRNVGGEAVVSSARTSTLRVASSHSASERGCASRVASRVQYTLA